DFALGLVAVQGAASGFDGMADDLTQCSQAGLLVGSQGTAELAQFVNHKMTISEGAIAGGTTSLEQIGEELVAAPRPGPILELKAETVQLFVEEPLRVGIAGDEPALFGGDEERGLLVGIEDAAAGGAAGEPGQVLGLEQQEALAAHVLE